MESHAVTSELGQLAQAIAAQAGALIRRRLEEARPAAESKSTPTDLVTATDREAEALIVEAILAARPHDGLLGEEGAARPGTSGFRWVIDPLDGTTNFVYGIPAFAVSIGVERDGVAVAGAVHDVSRAETYAASAGSGAFVNGRALAVSAKRELATALVGTGFGYGADRRAAQAAVVARLLPSVRDIRRVGAAALDLCWVAAGRLDGYYEQGVQAWDIAAGGLIVREAGGRAEWSTHTAPGTYVAAGPALFPLLLGAIRG